MSKLTKLEKQLLEEQERQLAEFKPQRTDLPSDAVQQVTGPSEAAKNFDQKIYMFPESYNALRKELVENWPHLWALAGWRMAFKAEEFVEVMNAALSINLQFDTGKVEAICHEYLNELRAKRGLSKISRPN